MIHFDSSFLIDLHQEIERERPAGAVDFMESLAETEVLGVSVHVLCELRVGAELHRQVLREQELMDEFLKGLYVAYPNEHFASLYGRLLAAITRSRRSIGTMDLLIATAALLDDAALVTRNVKDFSRVPGLRVLGY